MPDIGALSVVLSSFKAAKDIAEAMVGLRDAAAFQGKMVEFQSKIIDAQNAAFAAQEERSALLDKIRDLEAKVASFETWEAEKQRYHLKEIASGVFAYALKEDTRGSEPPHLLCTNCFQQKQKCVLQFEQRDGGRQHIHVCPRCKANYLVFGTALSMRPR